MQINTTRFGAIEIQAEDMLFFPHGVIGFEKFRHWVLLTDSENDSVGWLQSVASPEIAMAVVSPRRFVPDYQVRVPASQISDLQLQDSEKNYVLLILTNHDGRLTLNLRAPLIINLQRYIGRQVVTNDEQPLQLELSGLPASFRKSA